MTKPVRRTSAAAPHTIAKPAQTALTARVAGFADKYASDKQSVARTDMVADWLLGSDYIIYYPVMARMLDSINAAVLLCKIWFWSNTPTVTAREEGGFWWTQEDITLQTGLSKKRTQDARDLLQRRGIIRTKVQGIPPKLWWYLEKEEFFRQARLFIESSEDYKED